MINHVRTHLLNRRKDGTPASFPGECYVDPAFVPRRLPPSIQGAYSTLFGRRPDRLFLNYRVQQLLRVIHSTELEEYVYVDDPRVTYLPFDPQFFESVFKTVIASSHEHRLYVQGSHVADEANGRCDEAWDVTVQDDAVTVRRKKGTVESVSVPVTYVGGLSSSIPLTGTNLSVRIAQSPEGTKWEVTSRARPATDVSTLMASLETSFGERGVSTVLPPNSPEPLKTFEKVWREHEIAAYRWSALLLALARHVASLPQEA